MENKKLAYGIGAAVLVGLAGYYLYTTSKNVKDTKQKKDVKKSKIEPKVGTMQYELQGVENEELATFGAGCYWGTEKHFVTNL